MQESLTITEVHGTLGPHGRKVDDCEKVAAAISETTGVTDYTILYSTKEYKKTRVRYFTPDYDEWEAKYLKAPVG